MDPQQLRQLITDVLMDVRMYSQDAVELLMMTAAQETHCGRWVEQLNGGPALGIFQMEPATIDDLFDNYLRYKINKQAQAIKYMYAGPTTTDIEMRSNLALQIVLARLYYSRFKEALPSYKDMVKMAEYYKKYWNTDAGKATVEEAINSYTKWAM